MWGTIDSVIIIMYYKFVGNKDHYGFHSDLETYDGYFIVFMKYAHQPDPNWTLIPAKEIILWKIKHVPILKYNPQTDHWEDA